MGICESLCSEHCNPDHIGIPSPHPAVLANTPPFFWRNGGVSPVRWGRHQHYTSLGAWGVSSTCLLELPVFLLNSFCKPALMCNPNAQNLMGNSNLPKKTTEDLFMTPTPSVLIHPCVALHNTTENKTRHDTVLQHNKTQHESKKKDKAQHRAQRSTVQHKDSTQDKKKTARHKHKHNTTQHNTTQHNTTQHNTTQHNTNTIPRGTTQHSTAQHSAVQHNAHSGTQRKRTAITAPCASYAPLWLLRQSLPLRPCPPISLPISPRDRPYCGPQYR